MKMTFRGVLEPLDNELHSVMVKIPFDPAEAWPVRNKLRVKGTIRAANSATEPYAFATSILRTRELGHFLLATQKLRKAAKLVPGSLAEIVLEPDLDEQAAVPPRELAKLFREDRDVKKWFGTLNYSLRKYICDMVAEPKSAEARVRRAEQWVERMMLTMEGEESPPPILQVAFRRQPLARKGWELSTENQRRLHLLGIFSCQSPEAQEKRLQMVLDEVLKAATRRSRNKDGQDEGL
jgi:uncharacterized protein YdeI (YjbR/CyaY-like superfamily)